MKLNNIKGMIDIQFGASNAELVTENDGVKYFKATDYVFLDAIEVKVVTVDEANYTVYKRFAVEGVDIDATIPGVSDEYEYAGQLMAPIKAEFLG